MKKISALVIAISFLLFSCQKEVVTDNSALEAVATTSMNKNKQLSFKSEYQTSSQILQPAPILISRITGTGTAPFLGQSTFVAVSTANFTTAPPFQIGGTATFTAANGDEFYTTFTGTAIPNGQGALNIRMAHTITSGIGRFTDISGSFVGYTVAVPGHASGTITYEGKISF